MIKTNKLNIEEEISSSVLLKNLEILKMSKAFVKELAEYKGLHINDTITKFTSLLESKMRNHGVEYATAWMKQARTGVLRYIAGMKHEKKQSLKIWMKIDSNGISKEIKFLIPLLDKGSVEEKRIVLTLLYICRWFKFSTEPDFTTIDGPNASGLNPVLLRWLPDIIKPWSFTKSQLTGYHPHSTTSMGPNGPAILTALDDLNVIPQDLKYDLYYIANDTDGHLARYFSREEYVDIGKKKRSDPTFRRLSTIDDKEGKCRIIAIFDYWSNGCLKPLHEKLNTVLRNIKEDCTFNQGNFKTIFSDPRVEGDVIYSVDLKSATDLMPADLQAHILGLLIQDEEYGRAWLRIMTGHEFSVPMGYDPVFYTQGQPMGAYSSWPMMAITHHLIIRFAAALCKCDPIYSVLGDDAIIVGEKVFNMYKSVIKLLGMELSDYKTFRSTKFVEFAKRFFLHKEEISPYPLDAILNSKGDYSLMAVGIDNAITKSFYKTSELNETRIIAHFVGLMVVFGADRNKARGPARKLVHMLKSMIVNRSLQNKDLDMDLEMVPYSLSCSRTLAWYKSKLRYIERICLGDIAKVLYQESIQSWNEIRIHLLDHDGLFQPPFGVGADGIWHPIAQVMQQKVKILNEINELTTLDQLLDIGEDKWGQYMDDISFVIPGWDVFNNRKGSALRARRIAQICDKTREILIKHYRGVL